MKYTCKRISLDKLAVSAKGLVSPLCESCLTIDCTNPIEVKNVSILGITKQVKVYNKEHDCGIVVECNGFLPKESMNDG